MKVEPYHGQLEPFGEVGPIRYRERFSLEEYGRITDGLLPQAMEDKWFIYFAEPSLFLHRSWTGKAVYRVDFDLDDEGATVRSAVCANDVLASQGPDYAARLLGFLIASLLLKREVAFPLPPGPPMGPPGLYQHHISGTGHPEVATTSQPKRWWRFWR